MEINKRADANQLELGNKIKLNKFLELLRPDIKKNDPKTFADIIKIAINIENALSDPEVQVNDYFTFEINMLVNNQLQKT